MWSNKEERLYRLLEVKITNQSSIHLQLMIIKRGEDYNMTILYAPRCITYQMDSKKEISELFVTLVFHRQIFFQTTRQKGVLDLNMYSLNMQQGIL